MSTEATPSAWLTLRGYWLWLARLAWILIALFCISLFTLGTVAQYNRIRVPCNVVPLEVQLYCWPTEHALNQLGMTWDDLANFYTPIATVAAVPLILIGCLVFLRKSGHTVGLLFSLALVIIGSMRINPDLLGDLLRAYPGLHIPVAFIFFLGQMALVSFLFLFPNGRFVPGWTRWLLFIFACDQIYDSISGYLLPSLNNLLWDRFLGPGFIILLIVVGTYALIFRYRNDAGPTQRHQIKWVVVAVVVSNVFQIGFNILDQFWQPGFFALFMVLVYHPLYYLGMLFAAVCIGISISYYHLWDIDFLINRTLVYSLLTAIVVGIYVVVVGLLGTTIQGHSNFLISILATGLIAVLVQPLRDLLQRAINRLMYGERDDPVSVLSRLGQRLEGTLAPDAVLPSLVETVAKTLKLPYVALEATIYNRPDSPPTADSLSIISHGQPQLEVIHLPLIYQSETIGQLLVAPRATGEALSPMDRHLLENIAHQAGMAVHAVSLNADLQSSRQRLVTAREEERRRLRRDLHDGLGPNLASQGLKLAAVKQLLENNPTGAIPLLEQVMTQNQSTVEEVRRLVYGLRPPALDELGLVAAIRDHVMGMDGKSALQIEITESGGGLPRLSAAVEVAAYRIVLEALTNVIRHAQAKHCAIRFAVNQNGSNNDLHIEIVDNGIGLPRDIRAGVGLRSMRERAEELGGTCVIEPGIGRGTRVCVKLPLTMV